MFLVLFKKEQHSALNLSCGEELKTKNVLLFPEKEAKSVALRETLILWSQWQTGHKPRRN
jgi:hypothetical protein